MNRSFFWLLVPPFIILLIFFYKEVTFGWLPSHRGTIGIYPLLFLCLLLLFSQIGFVIWRRRQIRRKKEETDSEDSS